MHVFYGVLCQVWLYVFNAHYAYVQLVEDKALGFCWVWKPIQSLYKRTKAEVRIDEGYVSVLYFSFIMHVTYDSCI